LGIDIGEFNERFFRENVFRVKKGIFSFSHQEKKEIYYNWAKRQSEVGLLQEHLS
jgi:hypothetical protein